MARLELYQFRELVECDPETGQIWARVNFETRRELLVKEGELVPSGMIRIKGRTIRTSHIVWLFYTNGKYPNGRLYHKDGNRRNDKIGNLQIGQHGIDTNMHENEARVMDDHSDAQLEKDLFGTSKAPFIPLSKWERHAKTKNEYPLEYNSWSAMRNRVLHETHEWYHRYGGRGIAICDRWINSFESFIEDMGPKPGSEYSLHRIDNDGNYEPNNCKWATMDEHMKNRSRPRS